MVKEGDMMTMDHNPERYVFRFFPLFPLFDRGLNASGRFPTGLRCFAARTSFLSTVGLVVLLSGDWAGVLG